MKCVSDIVYQPEHNLALDLYLPDDLTASACVIYAHGGGFKAGVRDGKEVPHLAQILVDAGFAMASVSYRLNTKVTVFDDIDRSRIEAYKARSGKLGLSMSSKLYGHKYISAMEDISGAIEFLWVEGKRLGIQHRKVALIGVEAGAIAGLGLAYPPTHWTRRMSKPDAVVALGGAIVQPWRIVKNGPPCLMINDTSDEILELSNAQVGFQRAQKVGSPVAMIETELGAHESLVDLVLDGEDENGMPYAQLVRDQFARLVDA